MTLPPSIPQPPEHDAWRPAGPQIEPSAYVDWTTFRAVSDHFYVALRQLELRVDGIDARLRALENAGP